MPLNKDQKIDICYRALKRASNGAPFVFFVGFYHSHTVCYYSDNRPSQDKATSAVSDLIQFALSGDCIWEVKTLYRSKAYIPSRLCRGIARFFKMGVQIPDKTTYDDDEAREFLRTNQFRHIQPGQYSSTSVEYYTPTNPPSGAIFPSDKLGRRMMHRVYMMIAYMRLQTRMVTRKTAPGYQISAILVNPDGTIAAAAMNRVNDNKSHHAEFNTLQGFMNAGGQIQNGSVLYTTLTPCDMCAGLIAHVFEGKDCNVIYGQSDPGTHATTTELDDLKQVEPEVLQPLTNFKDLKVWPEPSMQGERIEVSSHLDQKFQEHKINYLSKWLNIKNGDHRKIISLNYDALWAKLEKYTNTHFVYHYYKKPPKDPYMDRLMRYLSELILAQGNLINFQLPPMKVYLPPDQTPTPLTNSLPNLEWTPPPMESDPFFRAVMDLSDDF